MLSTKMYSTNSKHLSSVYSHLPKCRRLLSWTVYIVILTYSQISYSQLDQPLQRLDHVVKLAKRQALQRFLVEPDNLTVNIGESVVLPCRVSNKAGTLQWTRDGFGLGTDPRLDGFPTYTMMQNEATGDYSLKISSVTLEDDAIFQCQIGALDNVPGIRSQSAQLTVRVTPDDPVIVHGDFINAPVSLQNHQVLSTTAGTNIELICEAHGGRPAAELAWLNGRNRVVKKGITSTVSVMNDGKRFNTALKWTFEPTKSDHNKKMTCRSSHPTLTNYSTASILLEVKYPPEVKLELSRFEQVTSKSSLQTMSNNLHARVGDSLRIKCLADGNPGKDALEYQWFRGDEVIVGDYREELLLFKVNKSWHGEEIKCKVSNSVGTGKASITLNIAYGPSFLPSMELVYGVNAGDTARLTCNVDSNPSPEITWIKVGSSSVMNTGSKLMIRNVNQESVGEYLCRASVKGFTEISAIIYLRLNGPPKIRKRKTNDYAVLGESGHVDCLVESVPPPIAVTWIHNGQVFTSSSVNNIPTNVEVYEQQLREEAVTLKASFEIKVTMESDFGHYNCVAINKYGSDWHVFVLEQQTSFSTFVTLTVISISALVFVVLTTIICLLSIKHRNLVRHQQQQAEKMQKNFINSDESDNQNIYSTASTRTNSSSEKTAAIETGTIITRSGSTGSPRSSTSSFPPFMESNNSPALSQSNYGLNMAQHQHGPHSHRNHHHHHQQHHHSQMHHLVSSPHHMHQQTFNEQTNLPFFGGPFDMVTTTNETDINHSMNTYRAQPLSPTDSYGTPLNIQYSTLNRPILPMNNNDGGLGSSYPFSQIYQSHVPLNQGQDQLYQTNLYSMSTIQHSNSTNSVKPQSNSALPTPPPSLAKELDSCISKNSIATHV